MCRVISRMDAGDGGQFLGRIQPGTVLVSKPASILPHRLIDLLMDSIHGYKLDPLTNFALVAAMVWG